MPARRGALVLLLGAASATDYDFCGEFSFSAWTSDYGVAPAGGLGFGQTDPATGAGCRAATTNSDENAAWLTEAPADPDYVATAVGRPEITGEAGGWSVFARAHGYDPASIPACVACAAYACTVNSLTGRLSLSKCDGLEEADRTELAGVAVPYAGRAGILPVGPRFALFFKRIGASSPTLQELSKTVFVSPSSVGAGMTPRCSRATGSGSSRPSPRARTSGAL